MHEEIKRFDINGIIGDNSFVSHTKEHLVHWIETDMREQGYVPLLDMDPQYSQHYDVNHNRFEFRLSVYGVFTGEDEAWRISGVMNGKTILSSIPRIKSKAS